MTESGRRRTTSNVDETIDEPNGVGVYDRPDDELERRPTITTFTWMILLFIIALLVVGALIILL